MSSSNQVNPKEILHINQIQLLLAEKRTALSVMRIGIAILALPLSISSLLIATSKLYNVTEVWTLFLAVMILNIILVFFSLYLIIRSVRHMYHYERRIDAIKQLSDSELKKLI